MAQPGLVLNKSDDLRSVICLSKVSAASSMVPGLVSWQQPHQPEGIPSGQVGVISKPLIWNARRLHNQDWNLDGVKNIPLVGFMIELLDACFTIKKGIPLKFSIIFCAQIWAIFHLTAHRPTVMIMNTLVKPYWMTSRQHLRVSQFWFRA
jgi:hypothetical protein